MTPSVKRFRTSPAVCAGASAPVVCAIPEATPPETSTDKIDVTVLVLVGFGVVDVVVEVVDTLEVVEVDVVVGLCEVVVFGTGDLEVVVVVEPPSPSSVNHHVPYIMPASSLAKWSNKPREKSSPPYGHFMHSSMITALADLLPI